jgi:hypothetical protein
MYSIDISEVERARVGLFYAAFIPLAQGGAKIIKIVIAPNHSARSFHPFGPSF